jgi:ribosomal protein S8
MISPSLAGIIFSSYIENQVEGLSSSKKLSNSSSFYTYFSDSYHNSGKMRVKPHQSIDFESEFNESNSTAKMKFTAELEIPEKFPEEFADMPWYRIAVICDRIDQTSKLMTNASDEQKSKVNDFYSKVVKKTIDELESEGSLMRFDDIPDSLVEKVRYELYKMDDTKIPEIHYFEVKSGRPVKKKAKKYVESK